MVVHSARSIVVDEVTTFVCDKQPDILAFDRWSFIRLGLLLARCLLAMFDNVVAFITSIDGRSFG